MDVFVKASLKIIPNGKKGANSSDYRHCSNIAFHGAYKGLRSLQQMGGTVVRDPADCFRRDGDLGFYPGGKGKIQEEGTLIISFSSFFENDQAN